MIVTPIAATEPELRSALEDAELPTDDLTEPGRTFFRIADEAETLGFGGFELYGENALLRSLVMLPKARGKGLGHRATNMLLEHARAAGACHAFLLTTDAAPFFERTGFLVISRDSAPPEILATRQAAALCPSSATMLMRPLDA